jgi:hypothetical protein
MFTNLHVRFSQCDKDFFFWRKFHLYYYFLPEKVSLIVFDEAWNLLGRAHPPAASRSRSLRSRHGLHTVTSPDARDVHGWNWIFLIPYILPLFFSDSDRILIGLIFEYGYTGLWIRIKMDRTRTENKDS